MTIQFSRRLAIVTGVVLPIVATARRWDELGDLEMWLVWLDDWAIAGFLLWGAWRTRHDLAASRHILAAAWGFACGLGYASFVFSLLSTNATDPSGLRTPVVAGVKGAMLLLALIALIGVLRKPASVS
jgi:hypothetical protein